MELQIPPEPTAEQCDKQERVADFWERPAYAMWYPQMGGYVGKAVVVFEKGHVDSCFDVFVWHDGSFPFSDDYTHGNSPAHLHHCMPSQFVDFGESILKLQESH